MCGIIAGSSVNDININNVKLLLLKSEDRGKDSVGFTDGTKTFQSMGDSEKFFSKETMDIFNKKVKFPSKFTTFVGHTRWATEGSKTIENAHPFRFEKVIGVHNGTVDNFISLKAQYEEEIIGESNRDKLDSDSYLLYWMINKFGLLETLPQLKGAMALAWYDENKVLNLYRNEKPLCYGYLDEDMYIASLSDYLKSLGCTKIKNITEHTWYKIKNGKVQEAKNLKDEYLPQKKSPKHRNDIDYDLEPGKKTTTTTKHTQPYACNRTSTVEETEEQTEYNFRAPLYAKGRRDEKGILTLWWFDQFNHNCVFVEEEHMKNILYYELDTKVDEHMLCSDYPHISEDILDEYVILDDVINERRKENAKV